MRGSYQILSNSSSIKHKPLNRVRCHHIYIHLCKQLPGLHSTYRYPYLISLIQQTPEQKLLQRQMKFSTEIHLNSSNNFIRQTNLKVITVFGISMTRNHNAKPLMNVNMRD